MASRVDIEALQHQLPFYKSRKEKGKKVRFNWQAEWDRFDAKKIFDFDIGSIPEKIMIF